MSTSQQTLDPHHLEPHTKLMWFGDVNQVNSNKFNATILKLVKLYKQVAFIEACYDIFFNETIEYDIMNEEPLRFWKKIELELYTKYVTY